VARQAEPERQAQEASLLLDLHHLRHRVRRQQHRELRRHGLRHLLLEAIRCCLSLGRTESRSR
jgi:hypothetical protein